MKLSHSLNWFTVICIVLLVPSLWANQKKNNINTKDEETIQQLKANGSDLNKIHAVDFFFYFKNESSAKVASAELKKMSYDNMVNKVETGYSVKFTKHMLVTAAAIRDLRKKFETIAQKHNGEYDGWGAPIQK